MQYKSSQNIMKGILILYLLIPVNFVFTNFWENFQQYLTLKNRKGLYSFRHTSIIPSWVWKQCWKFTKWIHWETSVYFQAGEHFRIWIVSLKQEPHNNLVWILSPISYEICANVHYYSVMFQFSSEVRMVWCVILSQSKNDAGEAELLVNFIKYLLCNEMQSRN